MILDEYVEVDASGRSKQYYLDKGYEIPTYINQYGNEVVKMGTIIMVKPEDLPKGSSIIINVKCDKCGTAKKMHYKDYLYSCHEGIYYCCHCNFDNVKATWIEKYGTENIQQVKEIREKREKTNIERYGYITPSKNEEVKKKIEETNCKKYGTKISLQNKDVKQKALETINDKYGSVEEMRKQNNKKAQDTYMELYGCRGYLGTKEGKEKYKKTIQDRFGVDHPSKSDIIKDKMKSTNLERYGFEYATQNEDIKKKVKKTNLEKFGYEVPLQSPEIKEKWLNKLSSNNQISTSIQQKYVNNILCGELNYPVSFYFLDIYKKDDLIDIEIDFGGHDLGVKLGTISDDEFKEKELIREKTIRANGIRIIRLISPKNKLPSDEKIKEIYEFSKQYFNTGHTWIKFYIEKNIFVNSINPDGAFYDFGELRKIKKKEVGDE